MTDLEARARSEDTAEQAKPSTAANIRRALVGVPLRVGFSFLADASIYVAQHHGNYHAFMERFQMDKFATVCAAVFAYNILDEKYHLTTRIDERLASAGVRAYTTARAPVDRYIKGQD